MSHKLITTGCYSRLAGHYMTNYQCLKRHHIGCIGLNAETVGGQETKPAQTSTSGESVHDTRYKCRTPLALATCHTTAPVASGVTPGSHKSDITPAGMDHRSLSTEDLPLVLHSVNMCIITYYVNINMMFKL